MFVRISRGIITYRKNVNYKQRNTYVQPLFYTQNVRNFSLMDSISNVLGFKKKPTQEELDTLTGDDLYSLASKYWQGNSEEKIKADAAYSVQLFKQARDKGSPLAAYTLAMLQLEDNPAKKFIQGESRNPIDTIQYLSNAGFPQAMFNLGHFHMHGSLGLQKDIDKAIKLFEGAALKGHVDSLYNLYLIYLSRGEEEVALKWLNHASDKGDIQAKFHLANWCSRGGAFIEKDDSRALRLLVEAAKAGHTTACHNLGVCYLEGKGCKPSSESALYYFRMASDRGYLPSKINLANIYLEGVIVPKDTETAKVLLKEVLSTEQEGFKQLREVAKNLLSEIK